MTTDDNPLQPIGDALGEVMKGLFFVLSGGQEWGPKFDPTADVPARQVTSPNQGGSVWNFLSTKTGPVVRNPVPNFSRPAYGVPAMDPGKWTQTNAQWQGLNHEEKAAAMALMEADGNSVDDAKNVGAAMVNRASKNGIPLGQDVSSKAYQPTSEASQEARLDGILKSKEFPMVRDFIRDYQTGTVNDPTNGATHFLSKPRAMLDLEAKNPDLYRSFRTWAHDPDRATNKYSNELFQDNSHSFLAPEGQFSFANVKRVEEHVADGVDIKDVHPTLLARIGNAIAAAPEQIRNSIKITSGYRSPETQAEIYERSGHGRFFAAAPPGHSMHDQGKALDISDPTGWLHTNGHLFGLHWPLGTNDWVHTQMIEDKRAGH